MLALAVAAAVLTIAYGAYIAPVGWDTSRDDQVQYLALARGLVERGEYTRATAGEPFIPEPLRFPGYPLLLAPLCVFGCSMWVIAIAQALLLAGLVLMVARFTEPLLGLRGARIAAAFVALHPAFAFFAAHALSDLLATVLAFAAVAATLSVTTRESSGIAAGALAGAATLTRPFLVFMPPLAALAIAGQRGRAFLGTLAVAALVFALTLSPYVVYVEHAFGRPVSGSTGAQLWLGFFQGLDPTTADGFVLQQAQAGSDSLARFYAISDRVEQAYAFVRLDDELRSRALELIAHDPAGFLARGMTRSVTLWAGDVPLRRDDAGGAAAAVWVTANLVLLGLGIVGAVRLARRGSAAAWIPLLVIVATWVFSYPLWAEGRFSLPARPFLAIGVAALFVDVARGRRV